VSVITLVAVGTAWVAVGARGTAVGGWTVAVGGSGVLPGSWVGTFVGAIVGAGKVGVVKETVALRVPQAEDARRNSIEAIKINFFIIILL